MYITIRTWSGPAYLVLITASLEMSETWAYPMDAEAIGQFLGGN